jgi:hypothetical protein
VSDSIKTKASIRELKKDTIEGKGQEEKKKNKFFTTVRNVAMGYTWRDTNGLAFRYGGLINLKSLSFNTVDGFIYGMDFSLTKNWKGKSLYIAPEFKWAFSRERLIWRVNSFYKFDRWNQSQIYIRTGQASVDFNTGGGINLFLNSDLSLLLRKNNLKLYESGYFTLGYKSNIALGMNLEVAITYEDRGLLENTTDFSLFRSSRQYNENVPANQFLVPGADPFYALRYMRHADLMTKFTCTPFQKYRVVKERKVAAGSDWPTFTFTWQHGINQFSGLADGYKHFDMLRFEAGKKKDLGAFSEVRWRVRTGGFLNNNYVTFYDFYHVNSQPLPLLLNNYEDAFMLPAFYSMSTPEFFFQAHTKYTTPFLLVKYLPFISNTLMRENISLSYLGSKYHKNYTEIGYSISEIFLLAEIGIYVGFEDIRYRRAGVLLTLKFN